MNGSILHNGTLTRALTIFTPSPSGAAKSSNKTLTSLAVVTVSTFASMFQTWILPVLNTFDPWFSMFGRSAAINIALANHIAILIWSESLSAYILPHYVHTFIYWGLATVLGGLSWWKLQSTPLLTSQRLPLASFYVQHTAPLSDLYLLAVITFVTSCVDLALVDYLRPRLRNQRPVPALSWLFDIASYVDQSHAAVWQPRLWTWTFRCSTLLAGAVLRIDAVPESYGLNMALGAVAFGLVVSNLIRANRRTYTGELGHKEGEARE